MPSSIYESIQQIVKIVIYLNPHSIMEIGPGFGKYGLLFREYLDIWDGKFNETYLFTRKIDCCEAFKKYITPVHYYIYNSVYNDDVINVNVEGYDLVTIIDVLEHLSIDEAKHLLSNLVSKNKHILLCIPFIVENQKAVFENEFERHKSQFSYDFFRAFKFVKFFSSQQLLCIISNNEIPEINSFWSNVKSLLISIGNFSPSIYLLIRTLIKYKKTATRNI